jgi:prevent-host-death family protein
MKSFSFSDLIRSSGPILDAAQKEPVALTKRGKERLVLLPAEEYHRLAARPQIKSYSVDDLPPDVAAELLDELKSIIREDPEHQ